MKLRPVVSASAQAVALYASGFFIPLLGQILALFTPLPLIIVYVRSGRTEGLAALGLASAVVALLSGWHLAVMLLFSFGLMAVGVGEGMRSRMTPEKIALLGGLLPVVALAVTLALYFLRINANPISAAEEYVRRSMTEAAKVYTTLGFAEMAATITAMSDSFVHYFVRLLPGLIAASSTAQAAFCYGMAREALTRWPGDSALPAQAPLALWHAPDSWVWGLIAALACFAVPNDLVKIAGWNLAILFVTLYLAQGIALLDYYLGKARIRPALRFLIHSLILVMPSVVFVIAFGIVDIWADFRKVRDHEHKT